MIQLQTLNYILSKRDDKFLSLHNLDISYFSDYRDEYNFIVSHLKEFHNIPDKVTFLTTFPDFDIFDVDETPDFLIKSLQEDRNTRILAQTFNKIRESIGENNIDKALTIYKESFEKIHNNSNVVVTNIFDNTSRYERYVDRTTDFSKFYVKTGFSELDEKIGGWDRNEELATLIARPGQGKSWCLLKIALYAAKQGLNVGIYSGEMSEDKVGYRIDTLLSHISNTKIIHGNSEVQVEYKKYMDSVREEIKGSIKVLTPAMIHGMATVSVLQSFIENENLDMLCIDQHSLLDDERGAKSPIEKASNISRDLKALQVLKKIPIIAVSQQNRESTENGVSVANVSQSDRIGQDSTIVIAIEQKDDILTLNLVKSRDSVSGLKLQYKINLDRGIFTYIPSSESKETASEECIDLHNEFDIESEQNPF